MLADIEAKPPEQMVAAFKGNLTEVRGVVCDVRDYADIVRAAQATIDAFGKVHVLSNNAGVNGARGGRQYFAARLALAIDVNLMGVVHGLKAFLPLLRSHGEGGHIVNTASMAGFLPLGFGAYGATKFAVVGISEALAMELACVPRCRAVARMALAGCGCRCRAKWKVTRCHHLPRIRTFASNNYVRTRWDRWGSIRESAQSEQQTPWSLGGGSAVRVKEQLHRDLGRTSYALRNLMKIANKDTQTVISALIKQAKTLPNELYKSLTWDRGKELTDDRRFTLATNIDVYFCDPQSPWQRGSNENTNRLLRQYFPKGTDLSVHSQTYLNKVARQLNERPRKTLTFETPADRFNACVASTG